MKGLFISFEGGDGSGKTTLLERIYHHLSQRGYSVLKTREPGGTELSQHVRNWLLHRDPSTPLSGRAELLLFLAARAQHLEERILPALSKGTVVLCDRFHDSSIAYQGQARGLGMDYVRGLCEMASDSLWPDVTLYLDIAPEEALARLHKGDSRAFDAIESESLRFHQKVREAYGALAGAFPDRIKKIDGRGSPDHIFAQAMGLLERALPQLCQDDS